MNFREKFEAWHKAAFGYAYAPQRPFTAMSVRYTESRQQARWEGWCACSTNSYQEGKTAGEARLAEAVAALRELHDGYISGNAAEMSAYAGLALSDLREDGSDLV